MKQSVGTETLGSPSTSPHRARTTLCQAASERFSFIDRANWSRRPSEGEPAEHIALLDERGRENRRRRRERGRPRYRSAAAHGVAESRSRAHTRAHRAGGGESRCARVHGPASGSSSARGVAERARQGSRGFARIAEETMGDGELEYHLTFPPTGGSASAGGGGDGRGGPEDDEQEFVFVYEEDKRPLVVLLGWAGCRDKYLAKYSAIYEERSCITLRCTAPVEYLFWRRDRLPRISRRLIQVITERCSTEHPVFFHVFSNGGAIFYQHISYAMQQAGSPLKVKGVIFDSSPGERRITSLYRAISAIIGGHPLTNVPISFMITFFLSFIWLFEILAQSFGKGNATNTDPTALAEETYSWPQIFLYSNADTLIRASDVEKFATRRAERGVRTQLVLFTDSPHVKHYATYREVYVSTVCNFINECLAEPIDQGANDSEGADETDSLLNLTKRIVVPQEAIKQ